MIQFVARNQGPVPGASIWQDVQVHVSSSFTELNSNAKFARYTSAIPALIAAPECAWKFTLWSPYIFTIMSSIMSRFRTLPGASKTAHKRRRSRTLPALRAPHYNHHNAPRWLRPSSILRVASKFCTGHIATHPSIIIEKPHRWIGGYPLSSSKHSFIFIVRIGLVGSRNHWVCNVASPPPNVADRRGRVANSGGPGLQPRLNAQTSRFPCHGVYSGGSQWNLPGHYAVGGKLIRLFENPPLGMWRINYASAWRGAAYGLAGRLRCTPFQTRPMSHFVAPR